MLFGRVGLISWINLNRCFVFKLIILVFCTFRTSWLFWRIFDFLFRVLIKINFLWVLHRVILIYWKWSMLCYHRLILAALKRFINLFNCYYLLRSSYILWVFVLFILFLLILSIFSFFIIFFISTIFTHLILLNRSRSECCLSGLLFLSFFWLFIKLII